MLFVGTSIIHPSTEGVFLLCNILDLLIYRYNAKIIVQKYKCFKNAWYVDFIGLVGIAVLILAA